MTEADAQVGLGSGGRPRQLERLPDGYYQVGPGKLANAVTWLEMRQKPMSPLAVPLRLVRAGDADEDSVRALFSEIGTPWLWSRAYSKASIPPGVYMGQDDVARTVGLVELADRDRDVEIVHFGLIPTAVGMRLGRRLMAAALELAWQRAVRVWLHTCNFDHPAAVRFYQSCGFVPYATGFEIMDDPRLQGKLPNEAAPHVPLLARP